MDQQPTYEELQAQLAAANAELAAKDAPAEEVTGEVSTPINAAAEPSTAPSSLPENWPLKGYTGPQPWEVTEDPPTPSQDEGLLIVGSAGPEVEKLARLLNYAGYGSSISRGEEALGRFDSTIAAAVESFRRDYGIQEDPAVIRAATPEVVGPWTWEALYRLGRRPQGS